MALAVKKPLINAEDVREKGLIPGLGRSPGEGIGYTFQYSWASLVAQPGKNPPAMQETWVQFLVGKILRRRKRQPTPVSLPGESHGQRNLVGSQGRMSQTRLSG